MNTSFHIVFCANEESTVSKTMDYLIEKSYTVFFASTENEMLKLIHNHQINLVVLELDLFKKDAITITTEIRNTKQIEQPFIFILSNKSDDYIQITAFNSGADDFMITPVKPIVFEPRLAILKKRIQTKSIQVDEVLKLDKKIMVDKEQYAIITQNGKIALPRKEFEMVSLMYFNANKIFTRQDFAKLIWNSIDVAKSRTIDIHIRNIRRILGNDIIKTTKGVGYTINNEILQA